MGAELKTVIAVIVGDGRVGKTGSFAGQNAVGGPRGNGKRQLGRIAIGAGEAELWGAERKADLAERAFGRAVEIVPG